jgi:PII-like signaling protein
MNARRAAIALRIFLRERDKCGHWPLYEAIVLKAREMHLRGATVLRGQFGFGQSRAINEARAFPLALDLPLVVEIVDTREKIDAFLPVLDEMMRGGLLTMSDVSIAAANGEEPANEKPREVITGA